MLMALNEANLKPSQLDYINAHATSTPVGDIAEFTAIKRLLNADPSEKKHEVYVSSIKGSLGHLLGAAGAVESAFTVLACKERTLPASINVFNLDPNFNTNDTNIQIIQNAPVKLRDSSRSCDKVYFLKNSFGFGGTNCSILFTNYTD
jgi:3-oxoacyl-[acyl-carrier-protein] synthase II